LVNSALAGLKEGKKLSGEAPFPGFRLALPKSCEKSRQLVKIKIANLFDGHWEIIADNLKKAG
jgi:hypothetical protein